MENRTTAEGEVVLSSNTTATTTEEKNNDDEAEEVLQCVICNREIEEGDETEHEGDIYCDTCFNDEFSCCDSCGEVERREDLSYIDNTDRHLCYNCYERQDCFTCDGCGETLTGDCYGQDGYCQNCWDDRERDNGENFDRGYERSDRLVEEGKRAFSCEIECYYPDDDLDILREVMENIDEGIGMTEDGSLNDCGKEFQTPKLSGEKGEKVLKDLCRELNDRNFYVNRTCGLHIHLDAKDFQGETEKIKRLMLFYLMIEPLLFSYLPFSRRKNRYCLPLAEFYHEAEIKNAYEITDIEKMWYREQSQERIENCKKNRYDNTRYAGINLHSMLSNNHLEIRHHSGTIDYTKIINWIRLHVRILDKISRDEIPLGEIINLKNILNLSQRQSKVFEMLDLEEDLQKYFIARNRKFGKEIEEDEKTLCAE